MAKGRDRMLRRPEGTKENKGNDAGRASSLHESQQEAVQAAGGKRSIQLSYGARNRPAKVAWDP